MPIKNWLGASLRRKLTVIYSALFGLILLLVAGAVYLSIKINAERFPEIDFEISCSKGTYIRSIASDFGSRLNSGATLIALRRTQSGQFDIANAKSVEQWIECIQQEEVYMP
mgnify:CR=1 FL=1